MRLSVNRQRCRRREDIQVQVEQRGHFAGRNHRGFAAALLVLGWGLVSLPAGAASLKLNPQLIVSYNYTDNLDAVDRDQIDPTTAQYINALVGLESVYKRSRVELGSFGNVGYTMYLSADGDVEDAAGNDASASDYNYFRANAAVWGIYAGRVATFELRDTVIRTRSLADKYGTQTDVLNDRFLYTDNVASAQVRFKLSPKTRFLVRYDWEMIIFPKPENDLLITSQPPDSQEHRGFVRGEYDFDSKNMAFLDLQGGQRVFQQREIANVDFEYSDYTFYQGLLGYRHRFDERTSLELGGGAYTRDYYGQDVIELEDFTNPLGRITLLHTVPKKVVFSAQGEYGTSTYGQNLFFDYTNGTLSLKYFFTPKVYFKADGYYNYNYFSRTRNDREMVWTRSRVDNIFAGTAMLHWDVVQKNGETWLGLSGGYTHRTRDSNIDGSEDYVGNPVIFVSNDTNVNLYFVEVQFIPMILIGG